jgi:nitroimidazol reductase NimA-like FMN-containing flavoprotein (pyridoxamine 5'-phosphate oxidase superfamily)
VARALLPLDRPACLALLPTQPVGRLIFTHRALPEVLPLVFRLDGEALLVRLASGSMAAVATRDAVVAFHVDRIDPRLLLGWSVTVVGRAREVTEPAERQRAGVLILDSWSGDHRDLFLRIGAERVSGHEIVAPGRSAHALPPPA